ncbi:hypothetical protein HDU89_005684 [Geranomyces variabilis]|nr:hypothetical protein HDU89_005684 [Geranomyces variabilis]
MPSAVIHCLRLLAAVGAVGMWLLLLFFCVVGTSLIRFRHARRSAAPAMLEPLPKPPSPRNPPPSSPRVISIPPSASFSPNSRAADPQGVTILRPLKGVDYNMVENLTSSFVQDYPLYELIFAVADPKDPAIEVVRDLIARFPEVDAKLMIGCVEVGMNPKINNLHRGYLTAKYDIIWILDSNVYVQPGCMSRSVHELIQPGIGLVHHLPCGVRPLTYGARLEQAFLNTAHAKMYVTINKVAVASCLIGKSNMFRRSDLVSLGGLENFGKYMSEDNIIGEALWAKGLRHAMTTDLAYQTLGELTVVDYFLRRARWIRIRKYATTVATLIEPLTESIVNGLLAAWGLGVLWGSGDSAGDDVGSAAFPRTAFLIAHFAIWMASDWIIASTLDRATRETPARFFTAWCVREVVALPLWVYAMAGSTVEWRGKQFWLNRDGTVSSAGLTLAARMSSWATKFVKDQRMGFSRVATTTSGEMIDSSRHR